MLDIAIYMYVVVFLLVLWQHFPVNPQQYKCWLILWDQGIEKNSISENNVRELGGPTFFDLALRVGCCGRDHILGDHVWISVHPTDTL